MEKYGFAYASGFGDLHNAHACAEHALHLNVELLMADDQNDVDCRKGESSSQIQKAYIMSRDTYFGMRLHRLSLARIFYRSVQR